MWTIAVLEIFSLFLRNRVKKLPLKLPVFDKKYFFKKDFLLKNHIASLFNR